MWVTMKSKYKAKCRRCYKKINKGQLIEWHADKKTVRHVGCEKGSRYTYGGQGRKVA